MKIKLSEYAKLMNIHYMTAFRWYNKGLIEYRTMKTKSGSIFVEIDEPNIEFDCNEIHIYARVSSHDQKLDLERQIDRLTNYAIENNYIIKSINKEIASGMNQNRKILSKLLKNDRIKIILVEHQDRLTRFGFNHILDALSCQNRKIIIMNNTTNDMDIVQDFIDVITSMCARIYGKRSAKNKLNKKESTKKDE